MLDSFFYRHDELSGSNDQQGEQFVNYNSHLVPAWLAERVWWTRSQSSLLNIYFRLSGFQSSLLLIHFWYSLSNCFYCSKVWHRTYSISEAPLWRSARRSSAPLQKLHRNHRSYVWTESLYGMDRDFVPAQELSGLSWTYKASYYYDNSSCFMLNKYQFCAQIASLLCLNIINIKLLFLHDFPGSIV